MALAGPSRLGPRRPLLCAEHGCLEADWRGSSCSRAREDIEDHLDELLAPGTSLARRQQALFSLEEMLAATQLLSAKGTAWSALRGRLSHALISHLAKIHVHVHHCQATDFHQHAALEMASCLVILQGLCLADEGCRSAAGRRGPMELLVSLFDWSVKAALAASDDMSSEASPPSSLALLPSHLLDALLCLIASHDSARDNFHSAGGRQRMGEAVESAESAPPSQASRMTLLKMQQFRVFVDGERQELDDMARRELRRQHGASSGSEDADTMREGNSSNSSSLSSSSSSSQASDHSPYASCRSSASSGSSGRSESTEVDEALPLAATREKDEQRQATPPFRLEIVDTGGRRSPKKPLRIDVKRAAAGIERTNSVGDRLTPPPNISIPATPKRSERHLRDLEQFRSGTVSKRPALVQRTTTPQCSPPVTIVPLTPSKPAEATSSSTTPPFTPRPMRCGPSPAVQRAQARSCSPVKRSTTTAVVGLTPPESSGPLCARRTEEQQAGEDVKITKSRPLLGIGRAALGVKGGQSHDRGDAGHTEARQRLGRGRRGGAPTGPRLSRSVSPRATCGRR